MDEKSGAASAHYVANLQVLSHNIRCALDSIRDEISRHGYDPLDDESLAQFPEVRLSGRSLYVNGIYISLAGRPLTFRLLDAFFASQDSKLEREIVMHAVYGEGDMKTYSERLSQANECNLNKLISRTRHFIKESLSTTPWSTRIDWFVYDHTEKKWNLFILRPQKSTSPKALSPFREGEKSNMQSPRLNGKGR